MNETVFDLLNYEDGTSQNIARKKNTYKSKYRSQVLDEEKSSKQGGHKTLGEAQATLPHTQNNYLKKHSNPNEKNVVQAGRREIVLEGEDHDHSKSGTRTCTEKRPPVPKPDERPMLGMKTQKNFVHENAVENIMNVPKRPAKNMVDTRNGDAFSLPPSGLEPVYTQKRDFGKTPNYLEKRKEELKMAQEDYDRYVADYMRRGQMDTLTSEDRMVIVNGLKGNWEKIHKDYQNLSVMVDTIPKKARKQRMEKEMEQLEKDIELLSKFKTIYVANY